MRQSGVRRPKDKGPVKELPQLLSVEELAVLKLRQHAHGLGFGGYFLTKSRAYSTTMGELRRVRREYQRRQLAGDQGVVLDAWGRPESEGLVEVKASWGYAGWGYLSHGEAWMASTAAARARERRRLGVRS